MEDKNSIQSKDEADISAPAAKRGRPKKETAPLASEASNELEMSVAHDVPDKPLTVADVQKNLVSLYTNALGGRGAQTFFTGFNQLAKYNPFLQNSRLKMINTAPGVIPRDDLIAAMTNPSSSEMPLRAQGWSLSVSQYLYYKYLRMAADVPMYKYYRVPELLDEADYKKSAFIEEDKFVAEWFKKFDVPGTCKKIALEVKREGKVAYVLRNSLAFDANGKKIGVNYCTLQKLPSDYVKLTGIGEHGYTCSFNFMLFLNPAFSIDFYPDFMKEIWADLIENGVVYENPDINAKGKFKGQKYIPDISKMSQYSYKYQYAGGQGTEVLSSILEVGNGIAPKSYAFWVMLPQDLCYVFASDNSHPWAIPDSTGMFLGLQELSDYDALAGLLQSTPLTAILTGEIEPITNAGPGQDQSIFNPETIAGFEAQFRDSASANVDTLFAPLRNMKLLSLPDVPSGSSTSTSATRNFVYRTGLGGLITTTEKPSIGQIGVAKALAEAEAEFLTLQFKAVFNLIVNKLLGCSYKWCIHLWGGIFSMADEKSALKELFVAGATFILPRLLSAYDLDTRDAKSLNRYVMSLDIYKEFQTITQASQEKVRKEQEAQDGETKKQGRPAISISDVDNDNTAASKDGGLDTKDTRSYAHKLGTCYICHKESDSLICEECAAKLSEEGEEE